MGSPLRGVDADVYMAANPSLNALNETCTDSGDHTIYTASVHKFWDKRQPLVVQCSPDGASSWAVFSDYVFEYAGGVIIFNSVRSAANNNLFVRISTGYYFALTELDNAHVWSLALKSAMADTTSFQAPGSWETKLGTLKGGSGKIDTFRTDGRIQAELGAVVALQLYLSKSLNQRWEALGWVTGVDPKADVKSVQDQSMSFEVEGDCYLRLI